MTRKTIKSILQKKLNDWINHIDDEEIQKIVRNHSIITGGSIVSLLLGEKPKDFDVYFDSKEAVKKVAEYYVKKFNEAHGPITNKIGYQTKAFVLDGAIPIEEHEEAKEFNDNRDWGSHMLKVSEDRIKIIVRSDGVAAEDDQILDEPFEDVYDVLPDPEQIMEDADEVPADMLEDESKLKYRPVFLSSNAITLSNQLQIVVRFYGSAEEIHKNYDFTHCTCYWTAADGHLELPAKALEAILAKQLIYQGSKYPLASVIRTRKFIKRGWHISAGAYLKMFMQINDLNLRDIGVLEDQLVGVDSAYFMVLIDSLRKKMMEDESFQLTNEYMFSIIDKVFG